MFLENGEKIKDACQKEFCWDKLLKMIKHKNVIPVIGQGLCRVDIKSEGKKNYLLYDYLTERVASECGATFHADENHKLAKACFEFLKEKRSDDAYLDLSDFLKKILEGVRPVPENSLWKLARIKNFRIFINTAYDNSLASTIKSVRRATTEIRKYTVGERYLNLLEKGLFDSIDSSNCTLVYHLFGNFDNMKPAYAEKDILETIIKFNEDMKTHSEDNFFQKLISNKLLFIGCGYDDWLFRFFIRILSNQPFEFFWKNSGFKIFASDDFLNSKKGSFYHLWGFLKEHNAIYCYPGSGEDFVDLLFEKLNKDYADEIIQPPDFPQIFISFEGKDRKAAQRLTDNLKEDGIGVWFDERELKGGDKVDEKIIEAINKYPVFMPLVSQNSKQITKMGQVKYHIQEWLHSYANYVEKRVTIIPVIIDDTKPFFDKFKGIYHYKISGGNRHGDYEKLKDQLIKLLR
jgi:hypothetical protein